MAVPVVVNPLTVILIVVVLSFIGAILSAKLRVSYPTAMIAIGLILSLLKVAGGLSAIPLDRTIILGVVVPPLIFEAAMRTRYQIFRTVRHTVFLLAILGVIISALLTGALLDWALSLPLAVALSFGVIVSPTDPVSVVSILKYLHAPRRLTTILETEAYLNDATAVILFPIAVSVTFSPVQSLSLFVYTFGGGLLVGFFVSSIVELLYRLITEPLAETSFTIAVMFGTYALAETFEVSGLVAVAVAGLYMGNRTMRVAMSKETRSTLTRFWDVLTFLVTSFAFLLLGLKVDLLLLLQYLPFILVAFAAIFLGRVFSVYPIVAISKLFGEKLPRRWPKVLAISGLRGAVSVALALSLPENFPFRDAIVAMTFGVALLSLIVQGELIQVYLKQKKPF